MVKFLSSFGKKTKGSSKQRLQLGIVVKAFSTY